MATKKKATKTSPRLQAVKQPLSSLEKLREQSLTLSNMRPKPSFEMTIQDCLEEMEKALAPLRYLDEACGYQDELEPFMVQGYLSLFLTHMDRLLLLTEFKVRQAEQNEAVA